MEADLLQCGDGGLEDPGVAVRCCLDEHIGDLGRRGCDPGCDVDPILTHERFFISVRDNGDDHRRGGGGRRSQIAKSFERRDADLRALVREPFDESRNHLTLVIAYPREGFCGIQPNERFRLFIFQRVDQSRYRGLADLAQGLYGGS